MEWLLRFLILATNPKPQASRSYRGSNKPCLCGKLVVAIRKCPFIRLPCLNERLNNRRGHGCQPRNSGSDNLRLGIGNGLCYKNSNTWGDFTMTLLHIVVLAVVQGITEFLPVSSSGHLILVPLLAGWQDQGALMDVAVHMGTLGAVMLYFRRD